MNNYSCRELVKFGNRSVVEVRNADTNEVVQYVVCTDFDNSKPYGEKWNEYSSDTYFYYVNSGNTEDALRKAIMSLYGIKEPKVPYERVMEFAKAFFNNMDIDAEQAENLKDTYNITENEADAFGVRDKIFPRLYKVVEVTFTRTQEAKVKVIVPNDVKDCDAEDYVENLSYLDDCAYIDSYDWECDGTEVDDDNLTESEVNSRYDLDEIWNGCDFPDGIY